MIYSSVVPPTVSTAGQRTATAHRSDDLSVPAASELAVSVPAVSVSPSVPAFAEPARPEPEVADFTTVFDIMGRIFSAV